jgi:Tfp pilus assembly protein PilF
MSDLAAYHSNLQRGVLLRNQRRYQEASVFLGKAIEHDPEKSPAYAELAICLNDLGGGANERPWTPSTEP